MTQLDCWCCCRTSTGSTPATPPECRATLIPEVREITPEIEAMAGAPPEYGSGGMVTKLVAARIAMAPAAAW
jgi:glutamate 5-kinase